MTGQTLAYRCSLKNIKDNERLSFSNAWHPMDFIWDDLTEGIICGHHHFDNKVVGTGNRMHFTHVVKLNKLFSDLAHLTAFHFDENVGEAHAKLLSSRRALAWGEYLFKLVPFKPAKLGQHHP